MPRILKANTAVRLVVGPFISITDGYTVKTGLTVTEIAMNMWHEHDDGSAPVKTIDAVAFTAAGGGTNDMIELAAGYYDIEITAAQTNITAGRCKFQIYDIDKFLPYFEDWLIVPANVFDSIMGTASLKVDLETIKTQAITCAAGVTVLASVGTAATSTAQTGDAYAALTAAQAEPGQAAPAVNASVVTKLAYLYKAWRNKKTQTATTFSLFNDAKDTVDQKAAVSDASGTLTVDEIATGP